jgi:hypothetical protein
MLAYTILAKCIHSTGTPKREKGWGGHQTPSQVGGRRKVVEEEVALPYLDATFRGT